MKRFLAIVLAGIGFRQALSAAVAAETPGAVVRSKEWVVRRGASPEEEFIGDVRYDSAGTRLEAEWALYRRKSKDWKARGDVRLRRELSGGDVIEARGHEARYDEQARGGSLVPAPGRRVAFKRVPREGEPDFGEGDRLTWAGESEAALSGAARGWGPRLAFWANEARWSSSSRTLVLGGGRPVLHKLEGDWTTALKADSITAEDSPRRVTAEGGVRGWLIFEDSARKKL